MSRSVERPLSPHLQIYRPMLTMMMSIVHRITGSGLYFGSLVFVGWLAAAATSRDAFETVNDIYGSWIGIAVLIALSWTLIHHAGGGIRHLIWDTGNGFGPHAREWMARANLIGSIGLTILLWITVWLVKG